jgi:hypothetical protein
MTVSRGERISYRIPRQVMRLVNSELIVLTRDKNGARVAVNM